MKKKHLSIHYQYFESFHELDQASQELIEAARNAMERAYAPYSNFKVGAAIRFEDQSLIEGNNQENAAYPSGLCAERVALFYAGAQFPDKKVTDMAVIASSISDTSFAEVVSPCGSCRQVMLETRIRQKSNFRVILVSVKGDGIIFNTIEDLLPFSFNLSSLLSSH